MISGMARAKVVLTFPTLPPSAISTSAIARLSTGPGQRHADVLEDRGDRRVWLVHGDLDGADAREGGEYGVADSSGGALQQVIIAVGKCLHCSVDDAAVVHGVLEPVGARGFGEIGRELEVDDEALADLGLVLEQAVACV